MKPDIDTLRLITSSQVELVAALYLTNKTLCAAFLTSLRATIRPMDLHQLIRDANVKAHNPVFKSEFYYKLHKTTPVPVFKSKFKLGQNDLPSQRVTTPAYTDALGNTSFQATPYCAKSTDTEEWRRKRGTDPEANRERWAPRPTRPNPYDRAKMHPHKPRLYGCSGGA